MNRNSMDEIQELIFKMANVIYAARLVVPTSESCPLTTALKEFDEYTEENDAIKFMNRINI